MNSSYFTKYLRVAPFSLALWRSLEANQLDQFKTIIDSHRPILDLGCGFGEFAGVFFGRSLEVGIDISPTDLAAAARGRRYKNLYVADARRLSLPSRTFGCIVSNSVLEHIPQVEAAIAEVSRVLRRGGYFIFTVPTTNFYANLLYPTILEKIGLRSLAHQYYRLLNKMFRHINLWPQSTWLRLLRRRGFKIISTQAHISPASTKIFDLLLLTALPSQLGRWMTGNRLIWRLELKTKILQPLFNWLLKTEPHPRGSNLIIVARKP